MKAHSKLWNRALVEPAGDEFFYWASPTVTSMPQFQEMHNDLPDDVVYKSIRPDELRMWMMFFALYFADDETQHFLREDV